MAGVTVTFKGDAGALERELIKLQAKAQQLEAQLRGVAGAGKRMGDDLDSGIGKALAPLASLAGGVLSVGAALAAGKSAWEVWLRNIREVGDEAKKAANELVVLASMQAGGAKASAVQAAARLAATYGITDRGMALDTVQSLQASRGDDFQAGMKAAREVFAATQMGMSLEKAREAEIIGASLGEAPGASVRRAYVAGVISPRSPEEVIGAAPALRFWKENIEGWAAAGVISAGVKPDELDTYVRAAGIGLSGVEDKEFSKFLKKRGFTGQTQREKLEFLHSIGFDTPEEMAQAGIGEIRRQQGMAILAKNYPEFERYIGEIGARDKPGLLEGERGGVEAELPTVRLARENAMLQAAYANRKAFGPEAVEALKFERAQRVRGLALQNLGLAQFGPFDLVDEEGRENTGWLGWGLNQAALNLAGGAAQTLGLSNRWTPSRISREEVQIELEQRGMTRDTIGGEGNRQNPTITKFQVSEMARDLIRKSRFGTSWGPPNSWDEKYHDYLFGKSGSSVGDWLSTARTAMSHGSPMRSEDTDAAMRQIVQQLGLENPNVAAMKAISGMDIKGFNDAVQSMKSSVLRMRGGPTLVPANEDR